MIISRPSSLFGIACIALALSIVGCSSEDSGQTLVVDAWPNVEVFERALPASATTYSVDFTAKVVYRGNKDLSYIWSWVTKPLDGGIALEAGATPENVSFSASGFVPATGPGKGTSTIFGDYVLQLLVYEKNGSIQAQDRVTVRLIKSSNG